MRGGGTGGRYVLIISCDDFVQTVFKPAVPNIRPSHARRLKINTSDVKLVLLSFVVGVCVVDFSREVRLFVYFYIDDACMLNVYFVYVWTLRALVRNCKADRDRFDS